MKMKEIRQVIEPFQAATLSSIGLSALPGVTPASLGLKSGTSFPALIEILT